MSDFNNIYTIIHIFESSGYGVLSCLSQESAFAPKTFLLFWLFYPHKVVPHITIGPSKAGTLDGSKPWIAKSRIKVLPGILPGCIKASIIIQCYTFLEICTIQDTGRNKLPSSTRIAHTTQHQRCSAWICLLDAIPDRSICPSPTIQTPKVTTTWYPSMF